LCSVIEQAKSAVAKFERAEAAAAAAAATTAAAAAATAAVAAVAACASGGGDFDFNVGVRTAPTQARRESNYTTLLDQRTSTKELTAKLTELRKMNRLMDRRKDELLTSSRSFVSR
jgi:hypothetical protein